MSMSSLEVRNISLNYSSKPVLHDISFSLPTTGISALLGVSGIGKSSLFHILAGLTAPNSGSVLLGGSKPRDITQKPGNLAYMLQDDLLLEHKRIIDNVALPLKLAGKSTQAAREETLKLLQELGLQDTANTWPHELSGGMRQRIAFLRTLITGHKLVLLDESFSALDPLTRHELYRWFRDLVERYQLSVLLITHDIDEALQLAQTIWVLGKTSEDVGAEITLELKVPCPAESDRSKLDPEYLLDPAVLGAKRAILQALKLG